MLKKILSRKTVIASLVSLAVLALGGGIWYIMIDRGFSLTDNPAQTVSISEVRAPEESLVYDDKITPLSLAVIFDKPAARMDLVGKKLDRGITVYPAIRGTWTFENDSYLSFLPEKDWIPGTRFRVSLSPELFNPDLKIKTTISVSSRRLLTANCYLTNFMKIPVTLKSNRRRPLSVLTIR